MASAHIVIDQVSNRAQAIVDKLPGAKIVRGTVQITSALSEEAPVNDHLVWLWGLLKHERKYLKALLAEGAEAKCICATQRGTVTVVIEPNAAEMLHLLGIPCVLEAR